MSRAQLTSTVEQNTGGAVAPFVAGKNAVINGSMEIWQRGTSFNTTGAFSTSYTADRWQGYQGGAGVTQTTSRQASDLPGFRYFARVQRNSGSSATGYIGLWQTIETAVSIPYAGQTVTLSFYARAGSGMTASNALVATISSGTGTDEPWYSATGSATVATGTVNLLSSGGIVNGWKRYFITGTVASTATEFGVVFQYIPTGTAGASDYYDITGIQMEIGSVPTPFSRAGGTLQGELALCQRYYYKSITGIAGAAAYTGITRGIANYNGARTSLSAWLPVTMRTTPSATIYSPQTGASGKIYDEDSSTDVSATIYGSYPAVISQVDTGVSAGHSVVAYFIASAEL